MSVAEGQQPRLFIINSWVQFSFFFFLQKGITVPGSGNLIFYLRVHSKLQGLIRKVWSKKTPDKALLYIPAHRSTKLENLHKSCFCNLGMVRPLVPSHSPCLNSINHVLLRNM